MALSCLNLRGIDQRILKSHLIEDMHDYGIKVDDYDRFISQRANAIALGLNVKLRSVNAI